jgi:hypothetical protein
MRLRLFVVAGLLAASGTAAGAEGRAPTALLPDLVQRPPSVLLVTESRSGGSSSFRLGFLSSFTNAGRGPLVIVGHRPSRSQPTMRADQLVRLADGTYRTHRSVGRLRYVKSETHQHWHLLPFDRYELRPADGRRPVRAYKSGFCLSDQFPARRAAPPRRLAPASFTHECGRREPQLLAVREGLSAGWGDYYVPTLEGQFFDVTDLPAGDYVLVNTLNAERLLLESDPSNDSASIRLRLAWPSGKRAKPAATLLRSCPGKSHC